MTKPSYWLRCENPICGPRFESGTRRIIVVGPRRRPRCNDDFSTAEKWHVLTCQIVCLVRGDVRVAWQRGLLNSCLFIYEPHCVKTVRWFCSFSRYHGVVGQPRHLGYDRGSSTVLKMLWWVVKNVVNRANRKVADSCCVLWVSPVKVLGYVPS